MLIQDFSEIPTKPVDKSVEESRKVWLSARKMGCVSLWTIRHHFVIDHINQSLTDLLIHHSGRLTQTKEADLWMPGLCITAKSQ